MNRESGNERTIGCREALRLLAAYLDDELGADRDLDVRRHLEMCRSCYSRAEFERRLKAPHRARLLQERGTEASDGHTSDTLNMQARGWKRQ